MKTAILACGTLKAELNAVMNKLSCPYPVFWLEAGNHNHPEKRRKEILQALHECREYDTVLLAMAFCGGALEGVRSETSTLVLPRCHDCITLLLGSDQKRNSMNGTYFLTRGWLEGKDNIWKEYQLSLERYGTEKTNRIFHAMLKNYHYLGYISTVPDENSDFCRKIDQIALLLNLEPTMVAGTLDYLADLISGKHTQDRFWVVPPGTAITREIRFRKGDSAYDANSDTSP